MTNVIKPRDAKDVEAAVQWALAGQTSLEVVGRGTKRALGRPAQWDATLDLSSLAGVTLYEPEELVLSARAGTPLAEIEALCRRQRTGARLRADRLRTGSRRARGAGHDRRHARRQSGRPAPHQGGRRARPSARLHGGVRPRRDLQVRRTRGEERHRLRLCKLLAGSWGTLAAMTDVTVKTLPRAETEASVSCSGSTTGRRARHGGGDGLALRRVRRRAPAGGAGRSRASDALPVGRAVTALRLEGVAPSVAHRRGALEELLRRFGATAELDRGAVAVVVAGGPRRAAVRRQRTFGEHGFRGASRPRRCALADVGALIARSVDAESSTTGPAASLGGARRRATTAARRPCAARSRSAAATRR